MARKTVGSFTYDNGNIEGPAAYIQSARFAARLAAIGAGTDLLSTCAWASSDPVVAALVSIQTDYAGWKGEQELLARCARSR